MGADGGLTWVRVKDRKRFLELIEPFRLLWNGQCSNVAEETHRLYLDNNSWLCTDEYVVSVYGTDVDIAGMDDVRVMLYDADNPVVRILTFAELLMSEVTDPSWQTAWDIAGGIMRVLTRNLVVYAPHSRISWHRATLAMKYAIIEWAETHPILGMKVMDWVNAVKEVIYVDTFGSNETWT